MASDSHLPLKKSGQSVIPEICLIGSYADSLLMTVSLTSEVQHVFFYSLIWISTNQGPVVQRLNSAIHRINLYPADSVIDFRDTFPLDSDLSGG